MKVKDFLTLRKNKSNYMYASDYIEDNKIKILAYYGKNGVLYTKRLDHKLTSHQLNLMLYRCDNNIVRGR